MSAIDRAIEMASQNPRYPGYWFNSPAVAKMMEQGVWAELHTKKAYQNLAKLSKIFGIKEKTLESYHYKLIIDREWIPFGTPTPRKVFTPDDEEVIAELIRRLFSWHMPITNDLVRDIMLSAHRTWPKLHPNQPFSASNHLLASFNEHHGFTVRKQHYKRQPKGDDEEINTFLKKAKSILENANKSHVVHVDETLWRYVQYGLFTWAPKGVENVIIETNKSEKEGFTTLATITADG